MLDCTIVTTMLTVMSTTYYNYLSSLTYIASEFVCADRVDEYQ